MPSFFPKRPFFGSTDWAAQQFLRLLDLEERQKTGSGASDHSNERRSGPRNIAYREPLTDIDAQQTAGVANRKDLWTPVVAPDPSRAEQSRNTSSKLAPTDNDYGYDDAWSDYKRRKELLDYVAQGAAVSEMVGSQLPGRERGPADAYRHILWAAELTRRFGEQRARAILGLHEREGDMQRQPLDERAMDVNNNEIGIQIGIGARDFNDIIGPARKVVSGSTPDGSGQWKDSYDPASTSAPFAASWLPEARWQKNPSYDRPPVGRPLGGPRAAGASMEMPTSETNWYSNPSRPNGPDWIGGYVSDGYRYPYGGRQHVTGPRDPLAQRAEDAYRFLLDRPWLYYPSKLFW